MKHTDNICLTKYHIGQSHSERPAPSDLSVFLVDETKGTKIQIINADGTFCNFPGIDSCPALDAEISVDKLPAKVVYSSSFEKQENGGYKMLWTVRPDGRFWMDSWGFGAEDYEWVDLYSYLDENGRFTAPFRLHSIGYQNYNNEDAI